MSNQKHYSIEEMEDAAVKKSNLAKTAGVIGAMAVGGVGTAFAAGTMMGGNDSSESTDFNLSDSDLSNAANVGANSVQEDSYSPQPAPQPTPQPDPEPEPEPIPEPEPDVTFESTEHYYVDEQEVATVQHGHVMGHEFALVDGDNDNEADVVWIDQNDNHEIEQNELYDTKGEGIMLSEDTAQETHHYYHENLYSEQESVDPAIAIDNHDDLADIHNDFEGEVNNDTENFEEPHYDDYAENNSDYSNDEDVADYDEAGAGFDTPTDDFADAHADNMADDFFA